MLACQSINITIEVISLFVLCMLIAVMLLRRPSVKLDAFLLAIVAANALATGGDLLAWVFTSFNNSFSIALTEVGNVVTYLFEPIACTGFSLFVCRLALGGNQYSQKSVRALVACIVALGAFDIALVPANAFTGVLYSIDNANTFTWGPWRTLPDNLSLAQFVLALAAIALGSKGNLRKGVATWALYLGIPVAAILEENTFQTLMLLYPAVTLSTLLAYIELQHRQEQALMRRNLELRESQVKALSSQITSHFVFNALQSVRELCAEDPVRAQHAIDSFSRYLRGNLQMGNAAGMVTFSQEIEHVKAYLAVEEIDPPCAFEVRWDMNATNFKLPPLCVQPLVENALHHGIAGKQNGEVCVRSWEDDAAWHVAVTDNGGGFDSSSRDTHAGIALGNVRTRLSLCCDGTLDLVSTQNGTVATITIPKKDTK